MSPGAAAILAVSPRISDYSRRLVGAAVDYRSMRTISRWRPARVTCGGSWRTPEDSVHEMAAVGGARTVAMPRTLVRFRPEKEARPRQ